MTENHSQRAALVCVPTYDERENVAPVVEAILAAAPQVDVLKIGRAHV